MASQLLEALLTDGATPQRLSSLQKGKIALQLAETDKALTDGADEYLQLTNLLAFTMRVVKPGGARFRPY